MAGSYLKFQKGDRDKVEKMYFYTSVENIPPWKSLRNMFDNFEGSEAIKETVTCKKSGFLAELNHLFTIGFYWNYTTNKLMMGVGFKCMPGNYEVVVSVEDALVKFGSQQPASFSRFSAKRLMTVSTNPDDGSHGPPSWSLYEIDDFLCCSIECHELIPPATNAYLEILIVRWTGFEELELTKCENENPPVVPVQALEGDKGGESFYVCSSADSSDKEKYAFSVSSKYFLSQEFSDAKIECGDGSIIPVHRVFLTAGCEYFARMFSNDMEEASSGMVKINEFSSGCVKELLRFIYTRKSSSLVSTELFIAADKYGLQDLKKHCENILVKGVTVENAVEMYEFGRMYGSEAISELAKHLVHRNKHKLIKDEDVLKEFTSKYPRLMFDLMKM